MVTSNDVAAVACAAEQMSLEVWALSRSVRAVKEFSEVLRQTVHWAKLPVPIHQRIERLAGKDGQAVMHKRVQRLEATLPLRHAARHPTTIFRTRK